MNEQEAVKGGEDFPAYNLTDRVITGVYWASHDQVAVRITNRIQSVSHLVMFDLSAGWAEHRTDIPATHDETENELKRASIVGSLILTKRCEKGWISNVCQKDWH